MPFGVDDVSKKRKATSGFFFGEVFSELFFDDFGGGDGDGGLALAWVPETLVGFGVERNKSGDVGFHGLIFAQRKG